jgi:hypothetical protein
MLSLTQAYIKDNGLLNGPIGLSMYFFYYAKYTNDEYFEDIAYNCIKLVYDSATKDTPIDFCNGLGGIEWSINYLSNHEFVETDETTLSDVASRIDSITVQDIEKEKENFIPVFTKGLLIDYSREQTIAKNLIGWLEQEIGGVVEELLPLSYFNSIIYFLEKCKTNNVEIKHCDSLENFIFRKIPESFSLNEPSSPDLYIFKQFCEICKYDIKGYYMFDPIKDIYMNWQTIIYEDLLKPLPTIEDNKITEFLSYSIDHFPNFNLTLGKMAFLGINLIKKAMEEKSTMKNI